MTVDINTLNGFFKKRYGNYHDLLPDFSIISDDIKFERRDRTGASYSLPVQLRRSMGWTFAGGANSGTAFALNPVVSGQTQEALITPTEFVARDQYSYGVAFRAQGSEQAFGDAVDKSFQVMMNSASFALEMALLYGGSSIGTVDTGGISGSGTTRTLTISKASWAPGLWSQMEGGSVDVYDPTLVTKRNSNADITVTTITIGSRQILVTGNSTDMSALTVGDVIVPKGWVGNVFNGLDVFTQNTGTLQGINAATYGTWKGNTFNAGNAAMSFGKVNSAASLSAVRAGMQRLALYVNTYAWADMSTDIAALRTVDKTEKGETVIGTNKIKYIGPNGEVDVRSHPMVKAGEAFLVPVDSFKRIGSTDLTFNLPDLGEEKFFRQLAENAGFELRAYWDQALFGTDPQACVKITNIVNNGLA